jgi:hypothetical protein
MQPFILFQKKKEFVVPEESEWLLCKIWSFNSGDYEEWRRVGCYAAWLL